MSSNPRSLSPFSGPPSFSRRAFLKPAVVLPLASLAAPAQNSAALWASARIMICSGGEIIGTDRVQCQLFDPEGKAVPDGALTVDTSMLGTAGVTNFKWEIQGGRLECNFRLPDANPAHTQILAFVPAPGGRPNRFYLLLSDDHLLVEDDPTYIAEGVFHEVGRLITKCQYLVEVDANGIPHPVAPFCTNCVYIFIRS